MRWFINDSADTGFDPRPREGATHLPALSSYLAGVSIRAPVRGRLEATEAAHYVELFRSAPP